MAKRLSQDLCGIGSRTCVGPALQPVHAGSFRLPRPEIEVMAAAVDRIIAPPFCGRTSGARAMLLIGCVLAVAAGALAAEPPAGQSPPPPQPATQPAETAETADWGCGPTTMPPDEPLLPDQPSDSAAQPRWVCDQARVEGEPVWQGKPASFAFVIRNQGTADLRIRAKGG